MSAGNVLKLIPMITIDTSTLNDVTYTEVTSGGLSEPLVKLTLSSTNTRPILISVDGINDHIYMYGTDRTDIIPQLSATPTNNVSVFPRGMKIYLKLTSMPGLGNFYISGYYQN